MAMRRFSRAEFWLELERRGCHRVAEEADLGSFWLGPNGRHFQVPAPDGDGTYPDWLLDDLIRQHGLPRAASAGRVIEGTPWRRAIAPAGGNARQRAPPSICRAWREGEEICCARCAVGRMMMAALSTPEHERFRLPAVGDVSYVGGARI